MRRLSLPGFLLFGVLALAVPSGLAHGVVEAQELEVHVLNDEGSDVIEAYGGYDITDILLGSAYVAGQGDLVYARLELYGLIEDQTALMPWTVRIFYDGPAGPGSHFLSTTDGANFEHDFLALEAEFETEERTLHVQRAYLTSGGPTPGQPITNLRVESYWGEDLRDVAPGGIPVPLAGGAVEYPDPTQIDGQGVLVEAPIPAPTDAYFGDVRAARNGTQYILNVTNGLTQGGQHVFLGVELADPAWTTRFEKSEQVLGAGGTGVFAFTATPGPAAGNLALRLTSDVGGRLDLELRPDGTLHARGQQLAEPLPPPVPTPPVTFGLVAVALLAVVVLRRT